VSGVLAVVAHPDDETLIAGGVLARCAENGVPARGLCLTRGELGGGEDPERTAGLREQELARATAELGAEGECLRHPDGELPWADVDAVADEVAARIEAQRPDVVVTFGEDGLYHHPDHVATNAIVLEAARRCGDPAVACAVWPAGHMTALVAAARERGAAADLWGLEPEAFGSADAARLVAVDVRPQLDRKLRALRCHASQFRTGHLLFDLPSDLAGEYLGWEFFEPGGGERIAEVAAR
jgi:N-acetyl-1-D-myo-inositol-2-amino-2-deoxy-alpha-D-glucopyranoside deacetylase